MLSNCWHSLKIMKKYWCVLVLSLIACREKKHENTTHFDSPIQYQEISKKQTDLILKRIKEFPIKTQISFGFIENGSVKFLGVKINHDSIIFTENYQSVFEIGSITKVFTSTLLAQYIVDGKVNLEDDITEHLHFDIKGKPEISFKQLANHTSGLPRQPSNIETESFDPNNPYQAYGESQLIQYLSEEMKLEQTPGDRFSYSNLGVGLLGFVLEQLESKSYEQLIQENIFSKYNMSHSTTIRKSVEQFLIRGLDENGNETQNWDLSVLVGAGGALSSTEDLSKFVLAQFDTTNQVLNLTRKNTFTIDQISDRGLGWEIIKRRSGDIWYKHNGGTGGYTSSIIMDVNNKNGIVILSNVSAYNSKRSIIEDWSYDLMKTIYN